MLCYCSYVEFEGKGEDIGVDSGVAKMSMSAKRYLATAGESVRYGLCMVVLVLSYIHV